MKLAVSNLAIPAGATLQDLIGLRQLGVAGIEVAPTRIAPWDALTPDYLASYRGRMTDAGLVIPSLQALLFGTEGLHLLQSDAAFEALLVHLRKVARIGVALGASIGVFGSPRNRLRGAMQAETAWQLASTRFSLLAYAMDNEGFSLGLEPVPAAYGGDFLCGADEVTKMVAEVDQPGLRVHLDTGCVLLGGGSIGPAIVAAGSAMAHFHVAEPKLGNFRQPVAEHDIAAAALRHSGYNQWIAIEMLESPEGMLEVTRAIQTVANIYLNV